MLDSVKRMIVSRKNKNRFRRAWNKSVELYVKFLQTVQSSDLYERKGECKVGILITPWLGLPVCWYAMTIGLILKSKAYTNVTLIVNDTWEKENVLSPNYVSQIQSIKKVLSGNSFKQWSIETLLLSDMPDDTLEETDKNMMLHYAALNTIKYWGNSIKDEGHVEIQDMWIELYSKMFGKIKECSKLGWDRIVIPGGAFQETGLFLELFKKKGVDVITYDSGPGNLALGINACASQNKNIGKIVQSIMEEKYEIKIDNAINIAKEICLNRMGANPEISVVGKGDIIQNVTYSESVSKGYDIVLFTNLEFDTSALGTHDAFNDDYTWITETIRFVLENTMATIAVRQHPMQKAFLGIKTNEESIKKRFQDNERVTFIDYDEKINSYKLIEDAKVIIVNTSTIGLEAGMLGKMVVTDSHSYYSQASFVRYSNEIQDYFKNIIDVLAGEIVTSDQSRKEAAIYYFLTQRCSWAMTDFTPQPVDYLSWVQKPFEGLLKDKIANYVTKSIIEMEPLAKQICNEGFAI